MTKNIDKEIERLLTIKDEVDKINKLKESDLKLEVVSQSRYDFFASKNLLRADTFYYIATVEVGRYVEGFQG